LCAPSGGLLHGAREPVKDPRSKRNGRVAAKLRQYRPGSKRIPHYMVLAHVTLEDAYLEQAARVAGLRFVERDAVRWGAETMAEYFRTVYRFQDELPWADYVELFDLRTCWAPDDPIERLRRTHHLDGRACAALTSIAYELSVGIRYHPVRETRDTLAHLLDVDLVPLPYAR
jgi:hypothetical protein